MYKVNIKKIAILSCLFKIYLMFYINKYLVVKNCKN